MKRRGSLFFGIILVSLIIASNFVSVFTFGINTSEKKRFYLNDEVRKLVPPGAATSTPKGAPLQIEIVYPGDGSTLPQGSHTVQVRAYAKSGISVVELKIDGPDSTDWITLNFDGSYYTYEWTVSKDGTYYLTAKVIDSGGRSKQDINTVYVGSKPSQKWAIVIGIADYQGGGSDLWHPDEDAKDMKQELLGEGYPDTHILVLLNKGASAQAIISAIDWLISNEQAGDAVVFFYSGHGYRAPDSEGWDTDVESDGFDEMIVSYDFYGLPDGWFRGKFEALESTNVALMFGSCHSGGMFDDNDDLQGPGRVIASACEADQYGWDYLYLGNTLWGYWFIDQGLLANNANSVESAQAFASPYVVAEQPDSVPQLYDNYLGDFGL